MTTTTPAFIDRRNFVRLASATLGTGVLLATGWRAEAASAPASVVAFGYAVSDLDRSVAFYQDVIGLRLASPIAPVPDVAQQLWNAPGAAVRSALFHVPNEGFALELHEFSGVTRTPRSGRHNDPGIGFLNFGVIDGNAAFSQLRAAQPVMVSESGIPANVKPGMMMPVWFRDPDGFLLELMQGGWDADKKGPPVNNVMRGHFGVTVDDYEAVLAFYRDLFGFNLHVGLDKPAAPAFAPAGFLAGMVGIPKDATWLAVGGYCPQVRCEFFDFRGAPRTLIKFAPQDPGAAFMTIDVPDLNATLARMRKKRVEIVTAGQRPVTANGIRQIVVRGPSDFLVLLRQRAGS